MREGQGQPPSYCRQQHRAWQQQRRPALLIYWALFHAKSPSPRRLCGTLLRMVTNRYISGVVHDVWLSKTYHQSRTAIHLNLLQIQLL